MNRQYRVNKSKSIGKIDVSHDISYTNSSEEWCHFVFRLKSESLVINYDNAHSINQKKIKDLRETPTLRGSDLQSTSKYLQEAEKAQKLSNIFNFM